MEREEPLFLSMKNKHLRWLIIFGTAVLGGLLLIQVYWFRRAFDVAEKQFDHSVRVALMRVADSVSSHAEVKTLSSTFYLVATESDLNGYAVDSLVQSEFARRNLHLDYE